MNILLRLSLLLGITVALHAQDCDHSHRRTQNTLAPVVKFTLIPRTVTESSAVAFLAEAGRRNFRLNGTYGVLFDCEKRFKVSGEYLQQKLGYKYSTGTARRWVRQFACGATYEHDFCNPYITSGAISGYYSYAPTRHLSSRVCNNFRFSRRIAGATAYGVEIGSTISFWPCTLLFLDVNYDAVIYHRRFHSNKHVHGFGGSVGFHQQICENFCLDLRGEFRRPFNYYHGSISWSHPQCPGLSIGVFGSHTRGKSRLPSNTMAGIELNYTFAHCSQVACETFFCDCYCSEDLACWVTSPAVYMPEVLAIAEEKATQIPIPIICFAPTSSPIPPFAACASGPFIYAVGGFFTNPPGSNPLVFSAIGLPPFATIDPLTGTISGVNPNDTNVYNVVVTADNGCGSTSQPLTMTFTCPAPTSLPIANQNVPVTPGNPYSLDVVTGNFTSPCGQPFTFSATGLPGGSSINPVTGLISGVAPGGNAETVTVFGTTACGVTSQTFQLSFNPS